MAMGDASELSREWREGVQSNIRDLLTVAQDTANAVSTLEQITKAHGERLAKLEASPANVRGLITGYGGCLAYLVSAAIAGLAVCLSLVGLALTIFSHR